MTRRTLTVWAGAMSLVLSVAVVATAYFIKFEGNITGFFRLGDRYPASPLIARNDLVVTKGEQGYDGQFFLAIALDPLMQHEGSAPALDYPRYRYRRILYPALAHVLSLGHRRTIPYMLVLINVFCVPVLALAAGGIVRRSTLPSARSWALLALAPTGVWASLCLSTADLLASTLFLLALNACIAGKSRPGALIMALAVLTKETYAAVCIMLCLFPIIQGPRGRPNWWYLGSIVPGAAWAVYARLRIPEGIDRIGHHFGIPFGGVVDKVREMAQASPGVASAYDAILFVLLLAAAGTIALVLVWRRRESGAAMLCALPYLGILLLATVRIFAYYAHHVRVFMDLFLILALTQAAGRRPWFARGILFAAAAASVVFVVNYIR